MKPTGNRAKKQLQSPSCCPLDVAANYGPLQHRREYNDRVHLSSLPGGCTPQTEFIKLRRAHDGSIGCLSYLQ